MMKNPLFSAVGAAAYITLVASVMFYVPKFVGKTETIVVPIAVLCLFVLSAAVMGYLFFFQPFQLYMDNKKEEAVSVFLKTLGVFALITACIFAGLIFFGQGVY